jgi:hypothetical protein
MSFQLGDYVIRDHRKNKSGRSDLELFYVLNAATTWIKILHIGSVGMNPDGISYVMLYSGPDMIRATEVVYLKGVDRLATKEEVIEIRNKFLEAKLTKQLMVKQVFTNYRR